MSIRVTAAATIRPSRLMPILIIFLLLGTTFVHGAVRQKKAAEQKQIHDCGEMVSRSQCLRSSNCRWCQSELLDDTCFSKSESLRLPSHIFAC